MDQVRLLSVPHYDVALFSGYGKAERAPARGLERTLRTFSIRRRAASSLPAWQSCDAERIWLITYSNCPPVIWEPWRPVTKAWAGFEGDENPRAFQSSVSDFKDAEQVLLATAAVAKEACPISDSANVAIISFRMTILMEC